MRLYDLNVRNTKFQVILRPGTVVNFYSKFGEFRKTCSWGLASEVTKTRPRAFRALGHVK